MEGPKEDSMQYRLTEFHVNLFYRLEQHQTNPRYLREEMVGLQSRILNSSDEFRLEENPFASEAYGRFMVEQTMYLAKAAWFAELTGKRAKKGKLLEFAIEYELNNGVYEMEQQGLAETPTMEMLKILHLTVG